MKLIYVAGPFRGRLPWPFNFIQQCWNTLKAAWISVQLMRRGFAVICPHTMTFWFPFLSGYKLKWRHFMDADLEILRRCDALYFIGPSEGANIELTKAMSLGLPIIWTIDQAVRELKEATDE